MSRWDDYSDMDYYLVADRTELSKTLKTYKNTYRELVEAVENYY